MAVAVLFGLGIYAYGTRKQSPSGDVGKQKPTNPLALPELDRYNPAANDLIRPPAWTYDPLRIGYTNPVRAARVVGDYPFEKHLSVEGVDNPYALWKGQRTKDMFVQQQTAYIPQHQFLDNNFKLKGVAPHAAIRFLGDPTYKYVPPVTVSPV